MIRFKLCCISVGVKINAFVKDCVLKLFNCRNHGLAVSTYNPVKAIALDVLIPFGLGL